MADNLEDRLDDALRVEAPTPGDAFVARVRTRRRGRRLAGMGGAVVVMALLVMSWPRPPQVEPAPPMAGPSRPVPPSLAVLNAWTHVGKLPEDGPAQSEVPVRAGMRHIDGSL